MGTNRVDDDGSRIEDMKDWVDREMATVDLGDKRLDKRVGIVLRDLSAKPADSIPMANDGDLPKIYGTYRLFDNGKVTPQGILDPHTEATISRIREHPVVLLPQDTSELDYTNLKQTTGLGKLNYDNRRGLFLHTMLAFTPERLCLGVVNNHIWARESLGENKDPRRPIEEKESYRWIEGYEKACEIQAACPDTRIVMMADREADFYELFFAAACGDEEAHAEWIIRCKNNRELVNPETGKSMWDQVIQSPVLGEIKFVKPAKDKESAREVTQTLRAERVRIKAPKGSELPPLEISVILAWEENPPPGVEPLYWMLITSLPVDGFEDAARIIEWYLCRFQIEVYFKVLKTGCKVEKLEMETAERIENCLSLYMIIAFRILYAVMLGRICPDIACDVVFTEEEWKAAYLISKKAMPPETPPSLNTMVRMIAGFGGFMNRKGDGEPGFETLWKGYSRVLDFTFAMRVMKKVEKNEEQVLNPSAPRS